MNDLTRALADAEAALVAAVEAAPVGGPGAATLTRLVTEVRELRHTTELAAEDADRCPLSFCRALPDEPCVSSNGRLRSDHASRPRPSLV